MNTVVVIKKQIKLKPFIHIVLLYNQHDNILLPPPLTIKTLSNPSVRTSRNSISKKINNRGVF